MLIAERGRGNRQLLVIQHSEFIIQHFPMTATTPEYAAADSARPAPPAGLVLLLALAAAAATLQSVLSGWALYRGHWESIAGAFAAAAHGQIVADLPERLIVGVVLLLHLAAAAGLP